MWVRPLTFLSTDIYVQNSPKVEIRTPPPPVVVLVGSLTLAPFSYRRFDRSGGKIFERRVSSKDGATPFEIRGRRFSYFLLL